MWLGLANRDIILPESLMWAWLTSSKGYTKHMHLYNWLIPISCLSCIIMRLKMIKCVTLFQNCLCKLNNLFYGDDLETAMAERSRNIQHVR